MSGRRSFSGNAVATTLQASIGPTDMTFSVVSITNWPDTTVGPFILCIDRGDLSLEEKVLVSAYSGVLVTVEQRGADNTTPQSHSGGAPVVHTLDAGTIDQANAFANSPGTVVPTTSAVGDTAQEGTSIAAAAADHVHGRESFATGLTSSSAPGDVENDGVSTHPARVDHKHAREPSQLGLPVGGTGLIPSRFVGGTTSGPPTAGTWDQDDFVIDLSGAVWICSVAGTPGTWITPQQQANPAGRMYATAQTTIEGTTAIVQHMTSDYLKGGVTFNGAGNALVVPVSATYRLNWQVMWQAAGGAPALGFWFAAYAYVNGGLARNATLNVASISSGTTQSVGGSDDIDLHANDSLTLYGATTSNVAASDPNYSFLSVSLVSRP